MAQKYFLALDYKNADEVVDRGTAAIKYLTNKFSRDFVDNLIGVKINQDMLTGFIDSRYLAPRGQPRMQEPGLTTGLLFLQSIR